MPTAQVTKKTSANESTLVIQRVPDIFDELDILGAIQQRAFELFEQRDGEHGRDLVDWLQAETELVYRAPVTIDDHGDRVGISIGLGGFSVDGLSLLLANDQLVLRGEGRDAGHIGPKWLLVRVDLPLGADPDTVKARAESGSLTVVMRKQGA
jgi:HSP20 family molecular chaperone IbpA